MQVLSDIAWAVPPGSAQGTRPTMLIQALDRLGLVATDARYWHHGRQRTTINSANLNCLSPKTRKLTADKSRTTCTLSPVFPIDASGPHWVDMYDDWSIAPDIHRLNRLCAQRTYNELRRSASPSITVNSLYMAKKLSVPLSRVVPNGVDGRLASLRTTGDARGRLVIFGKFFAGRTDFALLKNLVSAAAFDEVILGAPGKSREMEGFKQWVRSEGYSAKVSFDNWVSTERLASLTGPRTVAAIPHPVTDYTLSQDLMKVYTFQALGIPVICPHLLWPPHLSKEYALLLGPGVSQTLNFLDDWISQQRPTTDWREEFIAMNSWDSRATKISELIQ